MKRREQVSALIEGLVFCIQQHDDGITTSDGCILGE